jgi:Ca2+-binding RTX toxin-like protein
VNVADYTTAQTAVNVDLSTGSATGDGVDRLIGIQVVAGTEFDDTLVGDEEDNAFRGYQGDDTIRGGGGDDVAVFTTSREGVTVDLEIGSATGEGFDSLAEIEDIWGSFASDRLTGNGAPNSIFGLRGADRIAGAAEDDSLNGGPGSDALDGGDGTDECLAGEANTLCENAAQPPTSARALSPFLLRPDALYRSAFRTQRLQ